MQCDRLGSSRHYLIALLHAQCASSTQYEQAQPFPLLLRPGVNSNLGDDALLCVQDRSRSQVDEEDVVDADEYYHYHQISALPPRLRVPGPCTPVGMDGDRKIGSSPVWILINLAYFEKE